MPQQELMIYFLLLIKLNNDLFAHELHQSELSSLVMIHLCSPAADQIIKQ